MRRILVLGCSLSLGSWCRNPEHEADRLCSPIGWYHFVPQLQGCEIDAYGVGGGSYSDWAQVMLDLDYGGYLSLYSGVIIAETTKGRFSLWRSDHTWEKSRCSLNDVHVNQHWSTPIDRNSVCIHPQQMTHAMERYGIDTSSAGIMEWMLDMCQNISSDKFVTMSMQMIDQLCIKHQLPIAVFSFFDAHMEATRSGIYRLDHGLYDRIFASDDGHRTDVRSATYMAHQTQLGNQALGYHLSNIWPIEFQTLTNGTCHP